MVNDRFYIVKDRKHVCSFVYSEEPFPFEIYSEIYPYEHISDKPERNVAPEPSRNMPHKQYLKLKYMLDDVRNVTENKRYSLGVWPDKYPEAKAIDGPKVYIGRCYNTDPSLLGEMTSYQYAIKEVDGNIYTLARTPGGYCDAIDKLASSIQYSEDKRDAWFPADVLGVYDRDLPEVKHAFPKFTISFYGTPRTVGSEETFRDIIAFDTDEVPLSVDLNSEESVKNTRALIKKFAAEGVTTRLFANIANEFNPYREPEKIPEFEANVKKFTELFSDLDEISTWGFMDEPDPAAFEFCGLAKKLFAKYDPKNRPLYINLGPRAHCYGIQSLYDAYIDTVNPDYLCADRYPFYITKRGPEVADKYFYSTLEIERNNAIDISVDHGMILGAIRVSGSPRRADTSPGFMSWQTNLLAAYGARYIEYYVYYYAHDYSILDKNDKPTWRWYLCRETTKYLRAIFSLLDDRKLEAVFHLENSQGGYDVDVTPYYGYRGIGEVKGNDAVLSFYDEGILVLTDKHACEIDGGEHDITLTGFAAKEWFNPETRAWEAAENCPAAKIGEDGLTVHFKLASQYIFR